MLAFPDRFVQQAVLQVRQKRWDPTFSENRLLFSTVASESNHSRLLAAVAERVANKRMLKLIRALLKAGVTRMDW